MPKLFSVLFIVSFLPIILAGIGGYLRYRQFGMFDNHYPRLQQAHMTGLGARVLAAQKNAWEALILFSAMCLLAYMAEVDLYILNDAAMLFLGARIAHAVFYLLDFANYRSMVYLIGWACCVYIGWQGVTMI